MSQNFSKLLFSSAPRQPFRPKASRPSPSPQDSIYTHPTHLQLDRLHQHGSYRASGHPRGRQSLPCRYYATVQVLQLRRYHLWRAAASGWHPPIFNLCHADSSFSDGKYHNRLRMGQELFLTVYSIFQPSPCTKCIWQTTTKGPSPNSQGQHTSTSTTSRPTITAPITTRPTPTPTICTLPPLLNVTTDLLGLGIDLTAYLNLAGILSSVGDTISSILCGLLGCTPTTTTTPGNTPTTLTNGFNPLCGKSFSNCSSCLPPGATTTTTTATIAPTVCSSASRPVSWLRCRLPSWLIVLGLVSIMECKWTTVCSFWAVQPTC